ncbi:MAG: LacI family DNA-binding transcriptional regulator [Opitutaceae bacterium]|nr:LacI family DNA-binding transcriptional regulator [Opitutaceae bacterium]
MNSAVTMKDIAERAGVTTATVSMSLRGHPDIPVTTRERIGRFAQELGYRPNPLVSALMRNRRLRHQSSGHTVLAFVCALEHPDAWRNAASPTRRYIRSGAFDRAAQRGYVGQEFWLHRDGMSPERFSEMLHARGIQGVLLGPLPDGAPPPVMRWDLFSVVSLSVPLPSLTLHTVCNDHYFSSLRTVQECYKLGYRRPGLLLRESHRAYFQGRWEAGFFTAQQSLAGVKTLKPLFLSNMDAVTDQELGECERWLAKVKPDVVVALNWEFAETLLYRLGRRVPRDIGLASLCCPEKISHISGVYQDGPLIGATAVDQLISLVERNEKGLPAYAITTMVEGAWSPGETLRAKPC